MRYLTKTIAGKKVSEVSFGTIPLLSGNIRTLPHYRSPSVSEAVRLLEKAAAAGITLFDSAVVPEYGDAELKLGEAFRGYSEVVISSKARAYTCDAMSSALDRSCKNLKADCIDIYGIHQVAPENANLAFNLNNGALRTLLEAKASGRIKAIGLGTHHVSVIRTALASGYFDLIQIPHNLLENGMCEVLARDLISPCLIAANKVLACGILLSYAKLADLLGYSLQPPIDTAIIGIGTEHELETLLGAYEAGWSRQNAIAIQEALLCVAQCNRCQACSCHRGIDISKILRYRSYMLLGQQRWVRERFETSDASALGECDFCRECVGGCPRKIPIPDLLHEFASLMAECSPG